MVRRLLVALVAVFSALSLSAQNYKISLELKDAANGEAVGFATVSATPEKGQPKYTLTDAKGKAVLEKVRPGKYTVKAEIMGYKPHEQVVEVKGDIDLGVIKMALDQEVLDAASVSAVGNPQGEPGEPPLLLYLLRLRCQRHAQYLLGQPPVQPPGGTREAFPRGGAGDDGPHPARLYIGR